MPDIEIWSLCWRIYVHFDRRLEVGRVHIMHQQPLVDRLGNAGFGVAHYGFTIGHYQAVYRVADPFRVDVVLVEVKTYLVNLVIEIEKGNKIVLHYD